MKTNRFIRSRVWKAVAVFLYTVSVILASLGAVGTIFLYDAGMYSKNMDLIVEENIRSICESDVYQLMDNIHAELFESGYMDENVSEDVRGQLLESFMQSYQKSNTNFFFNVTDENGVSLLSSYTDESRCSFTRPLYQYHTTYQELTMSLEEYEAYVVPENASLVNVSYEVEENVWVEDGEREYDDENVSIQDPRTTVHAELNTTTKELYGYVTGYVRTEISVQDRYYTATHTLQILGRHLYLPPIITGVCLLVWLLCLLYLTVSAGYVSDSEKPVASPFEKIPFDVFTVVLCIIGGCLMLVIHECSYLYDDLFSIGVGVAAIAVAALICLWWLCSCIIRVRTHIILRGTLIVIVAKGICRFFRGIRHIIQRVSVRWQASLGIVIYFVFQLVALTMLLNGGTEGVGMMLMLLLDVILLVLAVLTVANLHILEKGVDQISKGNLNADIPEQSPLFGPFLQYARQLNQISSSLNKEVGERMKSEMFKTELIANVSHDIRTPLTSIINYTDLLMKLDLDDPQAKEYLEVLTRQSSRLRKLTEDVLEASKATTGNIKVNRAKLDLRVLLEQMAGEYAERLEEHRLQLRMDTPDMPLHLMADGRLLWRVMDNLLGNVCKYAMEGSRIYLDARQADGKIICTLRNMSAEPLNISAEELMERFVRGDRSRNTQGSGLGLSIARSLTEIQGGILNLMIDGDLFKVILEFPA